jgi:hypothetical protein
VQVKVNSFALELAGASGSKFFHVELADDQ